MQPVHKSRSNPVSSLDQVGVMIAAVGSLQRHIGLLHRHQGQVRNLHLAWHGDLRDQPCDDTACVWVEPRLHPGRARQIAARCRQIARANGRYVPYGFSPPTARFEPITARFIFGPTSTGLTCATFVLAVFDFAGVPLAVCESWQARPDDVVWQQGIIELLRTHGAPPEHIAAVSAEVGCVRYRPEEVAGAAALWPPAAEFAAACEAAESILQLLYAG